MNVIISNKQQAILENLNIDIIKSLNGEFDVTQIIDEFKNFYYQRMIIDITAIKGYKNIKNLQKLSISLDMSKLILLLDDSEESSSADYLSKLISMGIYNFAKNAEGIMYLYQNPNSYRDVAQYQQLDNVVVEKVYVNEEQPKGVRIIGIKDLTDNAGSTTLCYILTKQLSKNYNAVAIEVDKNDFRYFSNKKLISTTSNELSSVINKNNNKDVIFVDMNKSNVALSQVHDILYLLERSTVKLNYLMTIKPRIFKELEGKKIILNQSLLSSKDVLELEYEARSKFFFNMPPLNERENDAPIVDTFLVKLGFSRQQNGEGEKRKKILGLF